ncbi:MAG: anthranilate synthase component I family protein [Balneolaceae bacterium]|nr:anthranilate synthase component I family protein [Balneolaceae bacterium]
MKFRSIENLFNTLANRFSDRELILLESQMPEHPSSGRSFAAIKPKRWIRADSDKITLFDGSKIHTFKKNPWEALKSFRNSKRSWLFGYLGYDLKNFTERLESSNKPLYSLPDLYFMEPETLLIYKNGKVEEIGVPVLDTLSDAEIRSEEMNSEGEIQDLITKKEYMKTVQVIKDRIAAGDFYELNFSYALQAVWNQTPYSLYHKMRDINPVPFGAYIQMKEGSVCSISPERFLKKTGKKIISEPIKGTTGRSVDSAIDQKRKEELLNEKNRAENLMIVDLVRHDLSKVSKTGSVRVKKLFDVQTFGTVHQLISTIEADADEQTDVVDIVKECFPMGSMTGAPKVEVMKTIEKLENYKRGIYSGAIGYFSPDDDFDFNVVIRSAIVQNNRLTYPVGGAITSDSEAEQEWDETRIKAQNLTKVFSKDVSIAK